MLDQKRDIQSHYDQLAPFYDWACRVFELAARLRRAELLRKAHGHVLDVAGGSGANLPYLAPDCVITAVDMSPGMLAIYQEKARAQKRQVETIEMDAEALAFADATFDCVVETLALCTIPDPVAALKEMKRVCKADGKILLLDHGSSSNRLLHSLQEHSSPWWLKVAHCHLTRNPLALMQQAGLEPVAYRRYGSGIFYAIEAKPRR